MKKHLDPSTDVYQKALRKIVSHLVSVDRPVYIGELALVAAWPIDRTEEFVAHLVNDGYIRHATPNEKRCKNDHVVVLIKKLNLVDSYE